MLHSSALKLTDFLFTHCSIEASKRPVLVYGCELALSTVASFSSIVIISTLLGDILSSLLFIVVFFFLRLFAGGFHTSTYARCFIITNMVFLVAYGGSLLLEACVPSYVNLGIGTLAGLLILCLTPVRNVKHPLSQAAYAKNKKISQILASLETAIFVLMFFSGGATHYFVIFAASLAAVAFMMIIPKIAERRG